MSEPLCPDCAHPMVLRTRRAGPRPGKRFFGCSRYPACDATREVGADGKAIDGDAADDLEGWKAIGDFDTSGMDFPDDH